MNLYTEAIKDGWVLEERPQGSYLGAFDWAKEQLMKGAGYVRIWIEDDPTPIEIKASSYWRLREDWVGKETQ